MYWNEIKAGDLQAAENALRTALGLSASLVFSRIREDKSFAQFVAKQAIERDAELTKNFDFYCEEAWSRARNAMGPCFISPDEMRRVWPTIFYDRVDLKKLVDSLPPADVLERLREDGLVLLAGPPNKLSVGLINAMSKRSIIGTDCLLREQFYEKDFVKSGWIAITKDALDGSRGRSWVEQRRLPGVNADVPNAAEIAWSFLTFMHARSTRLLKGIWVRTSSFDSNGPICVTSELGYNILLKPNIADDQYVGVLSRKKFRQR